MSDLLIATPRRVLAVALTLAGSLAAAGGLFVLGRLTTEPLYIPTESRADCLEVRMIPDPQGEGLIVRAWMWDGDGHEVWTRDLQLEEPLSVLWDETDKGQHAVDVSHSQAEEEMEMGKGPASREEWREGIKKRAQQKGF